LFQLAQSQHSGKPFGGGVEQHNFSDFVVARLTAGNGTNVQSILEPLPPLLKQVNQERRQRFLFQVRRSANITSLNAAKQ